MVSGSFAQRVNGNYDEKYDQEGGRLYLLYVRNFVPAPALRNGIVIQAMASPTQVRPELPGWAVQDPDGAWHLYFAGFDLDDRPMQSPGVAEADHRRPYYVDLSVDIPANASVAGASDADLARWLRVELR